MADPAVIRIFDTTLRDGEQSPGATMTTEEKLQVAEKLVRLNVDIIEAGFPAASPGDLAAVKEIARQTQGRRCCRARPRRHQRHRRRLGSGQRGGEPGNPCVSRDL